MLHEPEQLSCLHTLCQQSCLGLSLTKAEHRQKTDLHVCIHLQVHLALFQSLRKLMSVFIDVGPTYEAGMGGQLSRFSLCLDKLAVPQKICLAPSQLSPFAWSLPARMNILHLFLYWPCSAFEPLALWDRDLLAWPGILLCNTFWT